MRKEEFDFFHCFDLIFDSIFFFLICYLRIFSFSSSVMLPRKKVQIFRQSLVSV